MTIAHESHAKLSPSRPFKFASIKALFIRETCVKLIIGNKNYSSWSLRPWLLLKTKGIAFEEQLLRLNFDAESPFKVELAKVAPTGKVPVLLDEDFAVWDTLAIAEYLADKFPQLGLWPADARDRARARSLCSEMHSGFGALRNAFPMNIEANLAEVGARILNEDTAVQKDLGRIDAIWSEQLAKHPGAFLFGEFSIADAYFAPVCSRVASYKLPLSPAASAYVDRILNLPAMQEWQAAARAENDFLDFDEPYRKSVA